MTSHDALKIEDATVAEVLKERGEGGVDHVDLGGGRGRRAEEEREREEVRQWGSVPAA